MIHYLNIQGHRGGRAMNNNVDIDDIQEQIELTEQQEKAWKSLLTAIKKCKNANVFFYGVLKTLGALNGNNVNGIVCTEEALTYNRNIHLEDNSLQALEYPTIEMYESFADDTHWVILK